MEPIKHYFVVLELPGGEELKFVDGKCSPQNFWEVAASAIGMGNAPIISSREDTGVCEEFRKHVNTIKKFTTFVLVHLHLYPGEIVNGTKIHNKISEILNDPFGEIVIDEAYNFQLVTANALQMAQ